MSPELISLAFLKDWVSSPTSLKVALLSSIGAGPSGRAEPTAETPERRSTEIRKIVTALLLFFICFLSYYTLCWAL